MSSRKTEAEPRGDDGIHARHRLVEDWVIGQLRSGLLAPGDILPSESELCEKFGIGRSSVRNALGNLAQAGILETKKGIGSFLRAPDAASSMNIGFVCYRTESYIFPRMIHGCSQALFRRGYHLILNETQNNVQRERDVLLTLQKKGIDGIIIEPFYDGSGASNTDLLADFERSGIPVVLLDNTLPGGTFDSVVMDDGEAGRLVAEYLHRRGHRDVGIAFSPMYAPKVRRRDGVIDYLRERGVEIPGEWQLGYRGPLASSGLRETASRLLGSRGPRPTAFVCTNDEESIEVIKAANDAGVPYPEELSIISFDNSDLASLPMIELTSVNHPGAFMGDLAATLLLERIRFAGVKAHTHTVIQPVLVERSSVREVPHAIA